MATISQELGERQADLTNAAQALEDGIAEWKYQGQGFEPGRWHALVLDTNVLELHHQQLSAMDWWKELDLREGGIRLVIPSVVRDELDAQKLSGNQPMIGKTKVELRRQASLAIRYLNRTISPGQYTASIASPTDSRLQLYLQVDELGHRRLPSPDNEIVARAVDLIPYAERVFLASYDNNVRFTAELYGITTQRLDYGDVDEGTMLASMGR